MRYLFSKGRSRPTMAGMAVTIPGEWAERWMRQMNTPYAELRYDEQDSDRKEARRMLAIVAAARSALPPPDADLAEALEGRYPNCGFGPPINSPAVLPRAPEPDLQRLGVEQMTCDIMDAIQRSGMLAPPVDTSGNSFDVYRRRQYADRYRAAHEAVKAVVRAARAGAEAPPPEEP
jgi:hypothetical protein